MTNLDLIDRLKAIGYRINKLKSQFGGPIALICIVAIILLSCDNGSNRAKGTTENFTEQNTNCDFNSVQIQAFETGTNKLLDNKNISECFTKQIVDKQLGLVEVKNSDGSIKVSYYIEKDPRVLKFLDIKVGDAEPSRWRANQGHDLFITENENQLNFIFGDRVKSKIKGTITFEK